jgi:glycosyltransferase involved in cell wall biosynthesis
VTTIAVSTVRNAADVVGPVVRHMLTQVDAVIVADNLSDDGTRDIVDALGCEVVDDLEPAHWQGRKMTSLAHKARLEYGADWVVPFDSDEIWYSPFGTIREVCDQAAGEFTVLTADLYDHVPTDEDDPQQPDPTVRIGWRRRMPNPLHKVAARVLHTLTIHEGNHGADFGPFEARELPGRLIVRHYPYRSPEQFIAKARMGSAALALTTLPEHIGQHWRDYGRLTDDQLRDVFAEHFFAVDPQRRDDLIFDPAP